MDTSNVEDVEETKETVQDRDIVADANDENDDEENTDEVCLRLKIPQLSLHCVLYQVQSDWQPTLTSASSIEVCKMYNLAY